MSETAEYQLNPEAVEFGRSLGRVQAEQDFVKVLACVVAAAGGEVTVPDRLVIADDLELLYSEDSIAGTRTYRVAARLRGDTDES